MSIFALLGRQPEIGVAELESLYPNSIKRTFFGFAEIDAEFDPKIANRLGGTIKLMKHLTTLQSTDWRKIQDYLVRTTAEHEKHVPEGKLTIGLSAYGLKVGKRELGSTSLAIKKSIKATGRSIRMVANSGNAMSSAQVLHNGLTGERGWELVAIRDGKDTLLCQTVWEQDIIAYTKRDQARPKRDARVGMLPPKLAQIIINLASPEEDATVLDPFCGTGVLLQEAALIGYKVYGTDIEPRMIEYSEANLEWLKQSFKTKVDSTLEVADATIKHWQGPIDAVACETFLGKPMSGSPNEADIKNEIQHVNMLLTKVLRNIAGQLESGTRCCFAVPAWFIRGKVMTLPLIDHLGVLGYTPREFKSVSGKLIYHREDQIVGRQLLAITRK